MMQRFGPPAAARLQPHPDQTRQAVASPDRSVPPDDDGRVVPFRQRGVPRWRWPANSNLPVRDLTKYEHGETADDYRHRMTMNVLGLLVTIVLVVAGIWLVDKIAEMRKNQDCYLSGRRNCTPIEAPPIQRE
jgi:hypothetical protein